MKAEFTDIVALAQFTAELVRQESETLFTGGY